MLVGGTLSENGNRAPPIVGPGVLSLLLDGGAREWSAAADAAASNIRPSDFDAMSLAAAAPAEFSRQALAVGAAVALHACLCLGLLHFARASMSGGDVDLEIPIEVVIDSGATANAVAETRPARAPDRTESAPQQTPEPAEAPAAAPAPTVEAERRAPDTSAAAAPAPPKADVPDAAAARELAAREAQRVEMERARRARQLALERARLREREEERARRAAEQARAEANDRRAAARAREKRAAQIALASRESARATAARANAAPAATAARPHGDATSGFDAASYRALIARAVRAAVGATCSEGAGSRVVIALTIGRTGAIASASIASASGNSAFDAASVAAVRRAGPFPPPTGRARVSVPVGVACR
ncbi:MAG: TonB family protein [Hyphomicrobiales bacterium]|nr:TonB family protein [Hyphomicrobiales bacterium]